MHSIQLTVTNMDMVLKGLIHRVKQKNRVADAIKTVFSMNQVIALI